MYQVPSARRKKRKTNPLNLIPILDVVFILIFFLLASAQLTRTFEIGSDLPIYKFSENKEVDKEKFELKVVINEESITLINNKKLEVLKTLKTNDWGEDLLVELNNEIVEIKESYPEKSRVLVKANKKISYQKLINVLDQLRMQTKSLEKKKLFTQIIFES